MKISKKTWQRGLIILLVVILGVFLIKGFLGKKKEQVVTYRTEAVTIGDVRSKIVTSGTLDPITKVDVGSQVSGKITALYADFNDKIKKGDLLAQIDQENFKMQIQQQEANYRSSKASVEKAKVSVDTMKNKYDRAKSLDEKNLVSIEELETAEVTYKNALADYTSAEARLSQAEAQLNSAKVDLARTVILSPIDGVVINRAVNVGQTVAASYQAPILFQIANDLSKMQVQCNVDETDIGKVVQGQSVEFKVSAYPNKTFSGGKVIQKRLLSINTANVITYPVIIHVDNSDGTLMPGMTATVTIITDEAKNVLLVPTPATRFNPVQQPAAKATAKPAEKQAAAASPQQKTSVQAKAKTQAADIGRVWKLDSQGNPYVITIRIGVFDNSKTEVKEVLSGGELKEGDLVIIGTPTPTTQNQPMGPNPMGGIR
jgi:HlyD family secretion protein